MIKINKITDNKIIEELISKNGSDLNKDDNFIGVFINNKVEEFVVYSICDDTTIIKFISDNTNDFQLVLGAVKTLLFLSDLQAVKTVSMPLKYNRISKALRFENKSTHYSLTLSEYSNSCN